jgi:HlyD family secretion protein
MKSIVIILTLLAAVAGGAVYYARRAAANPVTNFRTVLIKRGDLLSTIGATGTAEPEEVVDVGAQVMGLILEFGPDPRDKTKLIDFGSVVEKGTVLARIDSTPYEAALDQAEAMLERSKADLVQLEAKVAQTQNEWERARKLQQVSIQGGTFKGISDADYDLAKANYATAKANVAVGKATIRQNEASLRVAKTNLGYTTIKSPVRGEIIDRRVNIGQTVVASLNTPSLFLIAKDLRRMQIWASVNEADIGRIHVDMPVRFTVDAYPGEVFRGKVTQVRKKATMTQNVVTYTVVVTTDNSSGRLLPYLTANVQFEVDQRSNVLLVPNAALRWKPQASQVDPAAGNAASLSADSNRAQNRGCVWIQTNGSSVQPLEVVVGASDGAMTEISGSGVKEGMQVVVAEEGDEGGEGEEAGDGDKSSNPFLPKPPKGSRPPPGPM